MNKLKTIIVDDEIDAISLIQKYFQKYFKDDIEVIATFTQSTEAFSFISSQDQLDLVIFDIQMPEMDGLELIESFPNRNFEAVFITAHVDFSLEAFKSKALDYILKPINRKEFIQSMQTTIERVRQIKSKTDLGPDSKRFSIVHKGINTYINYSDLVYLQADGSYTKIQTTSEDYITSKNLKTTFSDLHYKNLLKVNRSFVINLDHVVGYSKSNDGHIVLSNQYEVGISRKLKKEVLQVLDQL
ncbi:response regulator transcription factor [bacterium SCSIO 12643]|nr:response regulator transcription factor [bacterium SCSIO 12643]